MVSHYQYKGSFSDSDRRSILAHMEVATAFWNYMVSIMQKSSDTFMASDGSEEHLNRLKEAFEEMFEKTIRSTDPNDAIEYGVSKDWMPYLESFKAVPSFILEKRMSDIIQAYVRANNEQRRKMPSTLRKGASIPSRKTSRSKQSFRIPDTELLIKTGIGQEDSVVLVPALNNLQIQIPVFKKIPLDKIQSVTLSHNPAVLDDRLGPAQEKELMVTIWMSRPESFKN